MGRRFTEYDPLKEEELQTAISFAAKHSDFLTDWKTWMRRTGDSRLFEQWERHNRRVKNGAKGIIRVENDRIWKAAQKGGFPEDDGGLSLLMKATRSQEETQQVVESRDGTVFFTQIEDLGGYGFYPGMPAGENVQILCVQTARAVLSITQGKLFESCQSEQFKKKDKVMGMTDILYVWFRMFGSSAGKKNIPWILDHNMESLSQNMQSFLEKKGNKDQLNKKVLGRIWDYHQLHCEMKRLFREKILDFVGEDGDIGSAVIIRDLRGKSAMESGKTPLFFGDECGKGGIKIGRGKEEVSQAIAANAQKMAGLVQSVLDKPMEGGLCTMYRAMQCAGVDFEIR